MIDLMTLWRSHRSPTHSLTHSLTHSPTRMQTVDFLSLFHSENLFYDKSPPRYPITVHIYSTTHCPSLSFDSYRTDADYQKRREDTLHTILSRPPSILVDVIGRDTFTDTTTLLYEGLQSKALNKQLLFSLLDVVVLELFPELQTNWVHHYHLRLSVWISKKYRVHSHSTWQLMCIMVWYCEYNYFTEFNIILSKEINLLHGGQKHNCIIMYCDSTWAHVICHQSHTRKCARCYTCMKLGAVHHWSQNYGL